MDKRIKEIRKQRLSSRTSQADMAEMLGITQPEYSKLERGKKKLTEELVEKFVSLRLLPDNPEPMTMGEMVADAMELMNEEDQGFMMLVAQRMLS